VMSDEDVFTASDDVTGPTCGTPVNTYVRREPRPKNTARGGTASGSGFLLWQTANIITCNHVIEGASAITVHFTSGLSFEAKIVAKDVRNDIAVLKITGFSSGDDGLRLNLQHAVASGEMVHAIGYPLTAVLGTQPSIVSGQISSTSGIEDSPTEFRMTNPVNPGNSGGPILDERGYVVGITVSGIRGKSTEGLSFGTKITAALPLLQQLGMGTGEIEAGPSETASEVFKQFSKAVVRIEAK